MKQLDYEILCAGVCELVKETGSFISEQAKDFSEDAVETKSLNSLVSYVDQESERMLVKGLSALLPESGFITEEETIQKTGERFNWIIDPLDGTTNFIHGLPVHAVSVALREGDELVLGVVYELGRKECFYAWKNGPALLNGKEIRVSDKNKLSDCLLATGFPYYDFTKEQAFYRILKHFIHHTRGIRRMGSAAVDLAYVACGRFDAFWEYGLHPWDVAAGAFIVSRAGGKLATYQGGTDYLFGKEIVAGSEACFDEVLNLIKSESK